MNCSDERTHATRIVDGWVRGVDRQREGPVHPLDPLAQYLSEQSGWVLSAEGWSARRLSGAAWLYQHQRGQAVVAKLYRDKNQELVERYAAQELHLLEQAGQRLGGRCPRALGLWRGVLFLEYREGKTLHELVCEASPPGKPLLELLSRGLAALGRSLAELHGSAEPEPLQTDDGRGIPQEPYERSWDYAKRLLWQLGERGLWELDATRAERLQRAVEGRERPPKDERLVFVHGDATSSNFLFEQSGAVVLVDWERAKLAGVELDLGRLRAELRHLWRRCAADESATKPELAMAASGERFAPLLEGYQGAHGAVSSQLMDFYDASSSLRIARNGWLSWAQRLEAIDDAIFLLER